MIYLRWPSTSSSSGRMPVSGLRRGLDPQRRSCLTYDPLPWLCTLQLSYPEVSTRDVRTRMVLMPI